MAEHFLNRPQIRASFEEMRSEGMTKQMWMDPARVEPRHLGQFAEDQECPGARQRAAARVQEELRAVALVEERPAPGDVAPERLGGVAADRDDPLLPALAEHADEAAVEVDARPVEADCLRDTEPGAVEELDERLVAERARRGAGRRLDQPLRLAGGERLRERLRAPRELDGGCRVVLAGAEELLVAEEAARGGRTPCDRRRREAVGAQLRGIGLELLQGRAADRLAEVG